MPQPDISSPYVGLRPFREEDYPFFFGRDREVRVISANLLSRPLTILYGPSGVGKSSVLQAGIVPHLKATHKRAVLYFRDWQSDSFLEEIIRKCGEQVPRTQASDPRGTEETLDEIASLAATPFYLLLDQFEEYLMYQPVGGLGGAFDTALARIVNREDIKANVLIGLREDSLSKFDRRFSIRIPNLFGNTHEIERLGLVSATRAIEEPLRVFSERYGDGRKFEIEPALTSEILCQGQTEQIAVNESSGVGTTRARPSESRIETAFLQLVLTELWNKERQQNSTVLHFQTLVEMGGAHEIVKRHVVAVMGQLASDAERDIAARMFRYLVTPSRTKIAQASEDLVSYAEGSEQEVKLVLNTLTDRADARILRRLSNPEQYEIFHDVLAQPILDWCRAHLDAKKTAELERQRRAEAEQRQRELEQAQALATAQRLRADEQARSASRLRRMVFALTLVTVFAVWATIYAILQKRKAVENEGKAEENAMIAQVMRHNAEAAKLDADAARAESDGNKQLAQRLRGEADNSRQKAQEQGTVAVSAAQKLAQAEDHAAKAEMNVSALKTQLQTANQEAETNIALKAQLQTANQEIARLKNRSELGTSTENGAKAPNPGPPSLEWFAGGNNQYDLFGLTIVHDYYCVFAVIQNTLKDRLRLDRAYLKFQFQGREVPTASISELKGRDPSVERTLNRLTGIGIFRPRLVVDGNSQLRVALFFSKNPSKNSAPSTWKSTPAGATPPSAELVVVVSTESDPPRTLELTTAKSKATPPQNPE
jgi:hypothetical protein